MKLRFNNWLNEDLTKEEIKKYDEEHEKAVKQTIPSMCLGFILGIILYNAIVYFL